VLGMKLRFSDVSASLIHHRLIDSCTGGRRSSSSSRCQVLGMKLRLSESQRVIDPPQVDRLLQCYGSCEQQQQQQGSGRVQLTARLLCVDAVGTTTG
jgi:hypothetical protein